jgi:hypothetical protein
MRSKKEREPIRCPQCSRILNKPRCVCGWEYKGDVKSRPVILTNGELIQMPGDIFRPRKVSHQPDAADRWVRIYYRARNSRMTFRQAETLYAKENDWNYPPRNLPLMPTKEQDWSPRVRDVPMENLIPRPPKTQKVEAHYQVEQPANLFDPPAATAL